MTPYKFLIPLTVRVNDLNYGNHVSHQNFCSYFQESRVAYLGKFGYSELDIEGVGMLVSEAGCKYRNSPFLIFFPNETRLIADNHNNRMP